MRGIYCLFALILSISSPLHAQEADTVMFSVNYLVSFKSAQEKNSYTEDEMVLEVSKRRSAFYSRWARERKERMDSLKRIGVADAFEIQKQIGNTPRNLFPYQIYTDNAALSMRRVYCKHYQTLYYDEPMDYQQWEITDRDTTVMGYACQIAQCQYRGRMWTACFTTEIPVSSGPWKLCGLPGLILCATSADGYYRFEAIGLTNESGRTLYNISENGALKSSRKQDLELQQLKFTDINEYMKRMGLQGVSKYGAADGTLKPIPSQKPILIENE